MDRVKRYMGMVIRVTGICVLCTALTGLLMLFEGKEAEHQVRVLFAGTKDDADCAVLLSLGYCAVIDTGEEQDGDHILALLKEAGVNRIDCLILTHPDKDHIGGAPALLEQMPIQLIVAPYYSQQNDDYDALLGQAKALGIDIMTPARSRELNYGELSLRIWPPQETYYEQDNDYSLAVLAQHGDVKMFFAGDAQKKRIKELLTYHLPQVELYKVSYHGRNLKIGARLIEAICPEYAVVTAEAPGGQIEKALLSADSQIICTRGRDAVFVSDGRSLVLE